MRHTEFWSRTEAALGVNVARFWADQHVLSELGGRTPVQALDQGVPPKTVWAAVWAVLELPAKDR
ncbi:conserved hypothetical protein [metagenome]|uniref:DUF3046 domain-containing protein n=1 Tax=metagenome TaxID=256318 RepID=A0A2P2C138_9ZZZZ